jgi:hypothetical protein
LFGGFTAEQPVFSLFIPLPPPKAEGRGNEGVGVRGKTSQIIKFGGVSSLTVLARPKTRASDVLIARVRVDFQGYEKPLTD